MECPICFEILTMEKNCVTTECGHSFHTNCLMTNVSHNGFGCPCCRSAMAACKEDDEESVWTDQDSEYSEEEEIDKYDNDYTLRGLRLFMNRIEGNTVEPEDLGFEEDVSPPSVEYITKN